MYELFVQGRGSGLLGVADFSAEVEHWNILSTFLCACICGLGFSRGTHLLASKGGLDLNLFPLYLA
jgi:hypothetical protein